MGIESSTHKAIWALNSPRDRKFRALKKSPGPEVPGEYQNINHPAPGTPAFKILTPDRGPGGGGYII